MAWEVEGEHVDLANMEHVTVYINRAVKSFDDKPARHIDTVLLGGENVLTDDGKLILGPVRADTAQEHDPKARRKETLEKLNSLHERGHKYARLHGVKVLT